MLSSPQDNGPAHNLLWTLALAIPHVPSASPSSPVLCSRRASPWLLPQPQAEPLTLPLQSPLHTVRAAAHFSGEPLGDGVRVSAVHVEAAPRPLTSPARALFSSFGGHILTQSVP